MAPTILFYISLLGLLTLLVLKLWELKRGVKPFSVIHYKADIALRKYMAVVRANLRYLNLSTLRLLAVFLFEQGRDFLRKLFSRVEGSKLFAMIRGRDIVKGNGTVSSFLKKLSSDIRESGIPNDEEKK